MLSGFLLLSRHEVTNIEEYKSFLKKKWFPLFVCYELWIVVYNIYFAINNKFSIEAFIKQLALLELPQFGHWWYMPMIVGLYIFIPMLSIIRNTLGKRFVEYAFLLSFAVHVIPFFQRLRLDTSFTGSVYLTYIAFGYVCYLNADNIKDISERFGLIAYAVVMSLFSVFFYESVFVQMDSYLSSKPYFIWYNNEYLIVCSFFLFLSFVVFDRFKSNIVTMLSVSSFAIYLIHNIVIKSCGKYFKNLFDTNMFNNVVLLAFVLVVSFAVYRLVSCNKRISKLLFLR